MKRFVGTIIAYFLIIGALTLGVNSAYRAVQPPNEAIEKFSQVPYDILYCNVGSSHGQCGFNYQDATEKNCFNFALSSQMPSYDLRVLREYIDHFAPGGRAYIPISFFSLFGIREEDRMDFNSKNKRYYEFLSSQNIKNGDIATKIFVRYLPALVIDEKLFLAFLPKRIRALSTEKEDSWDNNGTSAEVVSKGAYNRFLVHDGSAEFDEEGNRIFNGEEIEAVYDMIDLLKSKDVEPILVTTPFLTEYTNEFEKNDPGFFDDFYGIIEKIVGDTGVRYFDYSRDERFVYDYSLFTNIDHLNKKGARKFTNILIEETQ